MKIVLFCHSLVSDWNHGNAHFLRGIVCELLARGHTVDVYEPADGWSLGRLRAQYGDAAIAGFHAAYPELASRFYLEESLDVPRAIEGADLVLVHEWTAPALVGRIGAAAARSGTLALFHDTHHRAVSAPDELASLDLSGFAGVLAFGDVLRQTWLDQGWTRRAWTWHEAADTRHFGPRPEVVPDADLVWIGNWGDDERAAELDEFLLEPARDLGLDGRIYGVRYPVHALRRMTAAGLDYGGWLPNFAVPGVFARHRCTVHVPRRAYARLLPGIPTIRMFEALACGIPLVSAPWEDREGLFDAGRDYLVARDGAQMRDQLTALLTDPGFATQVARNGRATIERRHTCAHRVDELLAIAADASDGASSLTRTGT
jgi:spore maturation protein CgeB